MNTPPPPRPATVDDVLRLCPELTPDQAKDFIKAATAAGATLTILTIPIEHGEPL